MMRADCRLGEESSAWRCMQMPENLATSCDWRGPAGLRHDRKSPAWGVSVGATFGETARLSRGRGFLQALYRNRGPATPDHGKSASGSLSQTTRQAPVNQEHAFRFSVLSAFRGPLSVNQERLSTWGWFRFEPDPLAETLSFFAKGWFRYEPDRNANEREVESF